MGYPFCWLTVIVSEALTMPNARGQCSFDIPGDWSTILIARWCVG